MLVEVLVPGGRLVCVVGDVCLSRRKHGRHMVMPMHADIVVRARKISFDNLSPIFWYKIANANSVLDPFMGLGTTLCWRQPVAGETVSASRSSLPM